MENSTYWQPDFVHCHAPRHGIRNVAAGPRLGRETCRHSSCSVSFSFATAIETSCHVQIGKILLASFISTFWGDLCVSPFYSNIVRTPSIIQFTSLKGVTFLSQTVWNRVLFLVEWSECKTSRGCVDESWLVWPSFLQNTVFSFIFPIIHQKAINYPF